MEIKPTFGFLDYLIFIIFFVGLFIVAKLSTKNVSDNADDYYLNNRKLNLFFYVLTTVATWYGGILGAGEFSYKYGISSWTTQGLPYYVFAYLFAIFFAKKVRNASIYTIAEIVEKKYNRVISIIVAFILLIIVSPAPYIFMIGSLISFIFNINLYLSILISLFFSSLFLYKGGFKTNIWTDSYEFFFMFLGFIMIVLISYFTFGGYNFLAMKLPENHLKLTGGLPFTYLLVWFLIALWTFADPGFHQRASAAKNDKVAMWGIIISIFFWFLFDFLTTSTGLYARAVMPDITNPVLSYPIYAERVLEDGLKGIFYVAMFATILSTSNSFMFLSSTIVSRDIFEKIDYFRKFNVKTKALIALSLISIIVVIITFLIPSVIDIWYTIGTIFLPGVIFIIFSCYYENFLVDNKSAIVILIGSIVLSFTWYIIKDNYLPTIIEPMLVGLILPAVYVVKKLFSSL
ncbi:MAG TPA: sodium:solute symporter family protein [Ignavibacteriales bacterium]|nr:sodium:solute symporter family protein [Ignavibacteriales bacterium]